MGDYMKLLLALLLTLSTSLVFAEKICVSMESKAAIAAEVTIASLDDGFHHLHWIVTASYPKPMRCASFNNVAIADVIFTDPGFRWICTVAVEPQGKDWIFTAVDYNNCTVEELK